MSSADMSSQYDHSGVTGLWLDRSGCFHRAHLMLLFYIVIVVYSSCLVYLYVFIQQLLTVNCLTAT